MIGYCYFFVRSSAPIKSLDFLKKLRIIKPDTEFDMPVFTYAMFLSDNINLERIYDSNRTKPLEMTIGSIGIQYNSKLCLSEIDRFLKIAKYNNSADQISNTTNGIEGKCHESEIKTNATVTGNDTATIYWNKHILKPNQLLLGYVVHYAATTEKNVGHLAAVDACLK